MKNLPLISNAELANRDFKLPTDRWFHIAPIGEFPHPTGAMQVIDSNACQSMVKAFNEEAKQPNFPGLLVDFDHSSHDPAQPTTAAGWITKIENRADGLWAQVRWSDLGEQALTGGRYRLTSPVWNRSDCDQWTGQGPDGKDHLFLRPLRLDRVALTNDPNLTGMKPLSNRAEDEPAQTDVVVLTRRAASRNTFLNYGTSEGARKGWETRRGGGMAAKKETLKGAADANHAANEAKLSQKTRFQLREKAKDQTSSRGQAAESRYRQLVARAAKKQDSPVSSKSASDSAPRAASKSDLAIKLPPRPETKELKISLPERTADAGGKVISYTSNPAAQERLAKFASQKIEPRMAQKKGLFGFLKETFAGHSSYHNED